VTSSSDLKRIWNQPRIPVVLRRGGKGQLLRVRVPISVGAFDWLKDSRRFSPVPNADLRCWELPKAWFNDFVTRSLKRFGRVYIVQPYREHETCSPACLNARGFECECSCMGANHGVGSDGSWFEVSDTFAVRSLEPQLACRLLTAA
jgi:hypothetical protein